MANTELSALRALEQAIRDCGLPGAMVSGTARLESIACALKGVEDAREDGGSVASVEAATPYMSIPSEWMEPGAIVPVKPETVGLLIGVLRQIHKERNAAPQASQPVSGAGMTDELIVKAVHDAFAAGRIALTFTNQEGVEKPTDVAKSFARSLLSASGQAASEKAQWALRQISQLDPQTGSIGTAVMMAKEALASTPAQQTEEKKGEQQ